MASIAFEEYKNKLNNLRPALDDLGGALHLDEARNEVEKLEEESAQDGFWNDTENSQRVQKRIKTLQHKLDRYAKLSGAWEDMLTMCEMAIEEDDDSMLPDLESEFHSFEETLESMRLETLLTGEYDANNAILTFHAGAGGTEAQDWTSMLYRMYNMWAERHGYTVKLMDYLDGDEAGIKSATIMIEGENAYGFLKSEGTEIQGAVGNGWKIIGFDESNHLQVGEFSDTSGLRDAVEFHPALIINGQNLVAGTGLNDQQPRTAIGQAKDGTVLMLVIDGRQFHSFGISIERCGEIMGEYGAYQASMLDGGSSSVMVYKGREITSPTTLSQNEEGRTLPDAFLIR